MRIRLLCNVFIRHADEESVVWCPRTGGCTVMRNVQPILDEVKLEGMDVEELACAVAARFECGVEDVREGVEAVVGELASQRFVEVKTADATERVPPDAANEDTRHHDAARALPR